MSNIETGGPAFPTDCNKNILYGMDLRDYFAAKALQALIGVYEPNSDEGCIPDCAESAYLYADAMMEARK